MIFFKYFLERMENVIERNEIKGGGIMRYNMSRIEIEIKVE